MKSQNKSLFFLFVFVCQLCMMNVISISFAVAKELSKVDQETNLVLQMNLMRMKAISLY
jgi:hypothetical protein